MRALPPPSLRKNQLEADPGSRRTRLGEVLSAASLVSSADGSLAAHFEHTVAILSEGPRILTPRVGIATERESLVALGGPEPA